MERMCSGALMVVPSGPGLATIDSDSDYAESIRGADFAIPDSGLMVLMCRVMLIGDISKLSGLEFLRLFLAPLASVGLSCGSTATYTTSQWVSALVGGSSSSAT